MIREKRLMLLDKNNREIRASLLRGDFPVNIFVNKKPSDLLSADVIKRIEDGKAWSMKA